MTPEKVREAYATYNRALYADHKISRDTTTHRDQLPPWVAEGCRIYHRDYARKHRKTGANTRIDDINLVRCGIPVQDWNRVLQWAHDERQKHGVVKHGSSMLLHDDGIIDPVAVDLAVSGQRAVRMTRPERLEALQRLLSLSLTCAEIGARLSLSENHVKKLCAEVRRDVMA